MLLFSAFGYFQVGHGRGVHYGAHRDGLLGGVLWFAFNGLGWGAVEAATNPLVAAAIPRKNSPTEYPARVVAGRHRHRRAYRYLHRHGWYALEVNQVLMIPAVVLVLMVQRAEFCYRASRDGVVV